MLATKLLNHKLRFLLISALGLLLSLTAAYCGGGAAPPSESTIEVIGVESEDVPEIKIIATEKIPLNNCGGNSEIGIDVERSRKFIYAIVDKNGFSFGPEYGPLKALLEKEYTIIDGQEETQTHTIHLATQANSHVIYTIAWKETLLIGQALVIEEGKAGSLPYKVKKGLTLEIQEVENVTCD